MINLHLREAGAICTARFGPDDLIGTPCANCGHTNVVHLSLGNPSLTECILCRLQQEIIEVKQGKPGSR